MSNSVLYQDWYITKYGFTKYFSLHSLNPGALYKSAVILTTVATAENQDVFSATCTEQDDKEHAMHRINPMQLMLTLQKLVHSLSPCPQKDKIQKK